MILMVSSKMTQTITSRLLLHNMSIYITLPHVVSTFEGQSEILMVTVVVRFLFRGCSDFSISP